MKTKIDIIKMDAHKLVEISKQKELIKSHKEAFDDFPVKEEIHKGKREYYITK